MRKPRHRWSAIDPPLLVEVLAQHPEVRDAFPIADSLDYAIRANA